MVSDAEKALPVSKQEWAATDVHKVSAYKCGKCGKPFESPADVYAHLDEVHPAEKGEA